MAIQLSPAKWLYKNQHEFCMFLTGLGGDCEFYTFKHSLLVFLRSLSQLKGLCFVWIFHFLPGKAIHLSASIVIAARNISMYCFIVGKQLDILVIAQSMWSGSGSKRNKILLWLYLMTYSRLHTMQLIVIVVGEAFVWVTPLLAQSYATRTTGSQQNPQNGKQTWYFLSFPRKSTTKTNNPNIPVGLSSRPMQSLATIAGSNSDLR